MKIVINVCYGGYGLSEKAKQLLALHGVEKPYHLERNDDILVNVVEQLGDEASDNLAKLKIVEIPNDVDWEITDYDGFERIEEVHRVWG